MRPRVGRTDRLLLRESLVRTRLVVEAHELGDEVSEVVLAKGGVVEELSRRVPRTVRRTRSCRCSGAIRTTRAPDDARTR